MPTPFRPVAGALLGAAAYLAASVAGAQSRFALTPFVATNRTLPGPSALYGVSLASYPGLFGMRVSGAAAGVTTPPDASGATHYKLGSWTADADAVISTAGVPVLATLLGGFVPSAFAGVGAEGGRPSAGEAMVSGPVLSYGAGVARPLVAGLGVETEARYRTPTALDGAAPAAGLRRGWEYRVGLTIRFGGKARSGSLGVPGLPGIPLPSRAPAGGSRGGGTVATASAARVLDTADDYVGTPYVYGGTTPKGFDCSGFVQYVFRKQGVALPRTSRQQAAAGESVRARISALRPGDLMLFDASSGDGAIDHVAIYAGGNRMIHSSSSGGGVRYDDLSTKRGEWFVDHMVAARRVVADGRSLVTDLDAIARAFDKLDPPDRAPKP